MATYTGHSTIISFGTTGAIGVFTGIGGFNWSRPALNVSALGDFSTTYWEQYIPGDLWDTGEMDFEFYMNPDVWLTMAGNQQPWEASIGGDIASSETLTITFPLPHASPWRASTAYAVGEIVQHAKISDSVSHVWKSTAARTSTATWDGTEEAFWNEIGTKATLVGKGHIKSVGMGEIVNNDIVRGSLTWQWDNIDGNQGPYFTATD